MTSSSKFEEAKKWIESIEPRWRLQILSRKFRIDRRTGEKTELPTRIRRFVEGVPWALVHDAIDYLLASAPYSGLTYNGVEVPGTYRPTVTSWTRDDKDQTVSKTSIRTNDGTYTLIQDLVENGSIDTYGAATSGNCSEEVITEWHWDDSGVDDIGSLPDFGRQGITYAVQAVSKNEDGTFDYALVRRRSLTQHSPMTVQTDDAVQHVEMEMWNNAYGDPESGLTYDDGSPLSLPSKEHVPGTKVEFQYSENDDCTYRVSVTVTTFKSVTTKTGSEKDQFSSKDTTVVSGQTAALPAAPEPSGGRVERHESQLRQDGTYENTVTSETERPVQDAVVEVSSGRRGVRRTVTSRNQSDPASAAALAMGDSVRTEKTPGKLYTNTVSTWIRSALMKVADVCRVDAFSHRHSETQAGLSSLPTGDVTGGTGGVVRTRTAQIDDEGSISEVTEVETEKGVPVARESWVYGLFGRRHRVESRSQPTAVVPPAASASTVGKTIVNELTPGGMYNITVEDIDRTVSPVRDGSSCEKTVFEHTDVSSTRDPSGSLPSHVDDAGGGVRHTVTGSLNDDGSSTVRETVVVEKEYTAASVSFRRTAKAFIKQTVDKNVSVTAQKPDAVGFSESHTTNPGGTHDLTKVEVSPTGCVDRSHSADDAYSSEKDNVIVRNGVTSADDTPCTRSGGGKTYRKDSVLDDDGVLTITERETSEKTVPSADVAVERKPRGTVTTTTDKSSASVATDPGAVMTRSTVTQGGRNDVVMKVPSSPTVDSAYAHEDAFSTVNDVVTVDLFGTPLAVATGGNGTVQTTTSEIDADGFRKTVTRTETSKTFTYQSGSYSDGTCYGNTMTSRGMSGAVVSGSTTRGKVVTVRSSKLQSGLFETVTEELTAAPEDSWSTESGRGIFRFYTVGFSNAASPDNYVRQAIAKAESWETSFLNDLPCERCSLTVSVHMNKFHLYDGTVTVQASWPGTAGRNFTSGGISYKLVDKKTTPMYRVDPDDDTQFLAVNQVVKTETPCTFYVGYGLSALSGKLRSVSVYPGSNFHYSARDGAWSITIYGEPEWTVTYEKPSGPISFTQGQSN